MPVAYSQYPSLLGQKVENKENIFVCSILTFCSTPTQLMDENNNSNNNDSKRSRTSSRSPAMRTPLSADDSSERSVELTLPPKKSSKHYNRRTAKNTSTSSPGVVVPCPVTPSINTNGRSLVDSTSDKENFCDREKIMGETITGDGPYQQMRLPDGQMVLMLQPHYMQLAAALGINTHDGMNQMMDFESLIELSRKHQHMVSWGRGCGMGNKNGG